MAKCLTVFEAGLTDLAEFVPGDALLYFGQRYVVKRIEPYVRKSDGLGTELLVWRSFCATCGEPFEVRTPKKIRAINRRCKEHAKPGIRVHRRRRAHP